jgi:uncharacterized repeat protein (TIGR02543 family)
MLLLITLQMIMEESMRLSSVTYRIVNQKSTFFLLTLVVPILLVTILTGCPEAGIGTSTPSHTVTFDANGGTGSMPPVTIPEGATYSLATNTFSLTGNSFSGWNTAANGSGTPYADGAQITMGTVDITLYAQWTVESYSLTFDANGGTGTMSSTTLEYDATTDLPANTFTRTDYFFTGWNTAANNSGTAYSDEAVFTMGGTDITLYAQWGYDFGSYRVISNAENTPGNFSVLDDGTYLYIMVYSGSRKLIKVNKTTLLPDMTFGTSGYLDLPSEASAGQLLYEGSGKFFLHAWDSTALRWKEYKFDPSGTGSFSLAATNSSITSFGNTPQGLWVIDNVAYIANLHNGNSSVTGAMVFDCVTEAYTTELRSWGSSIRLYGMMKDSGGQLWALLSTPIISKVDSTLALVAGDEKTPTDSWYSGNFVYTSPTDFAGVVATREQDDSVISYSGSVDDFLSDVGDDGELNGINTQIIVANAQESGDDVYYYISSATLGNNAIIVTRTDVSGTNYTHMGYYDITTGTHNSNFNGGVPLHLTSTSPANYTSSWGPSYTQTFSDGSNLFAVYNNNDGKLTIQKF